MILDDINIRKILQIYDYDYQDRNLDYIYRKKKIPYWYQNNTQIVVGFYINSISGLQWTPVISWRHIILKSYIAHEIPSQINIIKIKRKEKIKNILLNNSELPLEIIDLILYFY